MSQSIDQTTDLTTGQTTGTTPSAPKQKPAAGQQNAPTEALATPGRAITAAGSQSAHQAALPTAADAAPARQAAPPTAFEAASPQQAEAAGLTILAEARWPESALDHTPPSLAGFIISSFSPVAAETAARCLSRRPAPVPASGPVTAVLIATTRGDRQSAAHVSRTVAADGLLGPLLFFQSVPNAVAGHIATRWNLTGPVVCLGDPASALETAALLIEDGDADQALVLRVEQEAPDRDSAQAHALLLAPLTPGVRP